MPPKAAEGGKAKKAPKASEQAARAGQAACQGAEGCGLPQAKLWEKGAAFMAFLNASRQKQEDDKVRTWWRRRRRYTPPAWTCGLQPMQLSPPPLSRSGPHTPATRGGGRGWSRMTPQPNRSMSHRQCT